MHRVTYVNFPDTVRKLIEPLVERLDWILPSWVTAVDFLWDNEFKNPMEVQIHKEYRAVRIIVGEQYATVDNDFREEAMIHEFVHASLMPMKTVQHDVLDAVEMENSNPGLYRWASKVINDANEAATQDMTEALLRLIRND